GLWENRQSWFLRLPNQPRNRIIALPAHMGGARPVSGLKWIASYPDNVRQGVPRASAVLILNDPVTGYPFACLESSLISAARTAASAAAGAACLLDGNEVGRLGVVGTGLIARTVCEDLRDNGWGLGSTLLDDLRREEAERFSRLLEGQPGFGAVALAEGLEHVVRGSDLLLFATVAPEPYLHELDWLAHGPAILHVSLRDLAPEVVLAA